MFKYYLLPRKFYLRWCTHTILNRNKNITIYEVKRIIIIIIMKF